MNRKEQRQRLRAIIDRDPNSIAAEVAETALAYGAPPESFFEDLMRCGCVSGLVGGMIYYYDTHAFFDRHYDEIEDLRLELMDEGVMIEWPQSDLKNHLAWLAFEESAFRIARDELDMEL